MSGASGSQPRPVRIRRDRSFDRASSDIDILVTFEDMAVGGYADSFFGLHAALEKLFERPVDLLTDRSIDNPFLRPSIEATCVVLSTESAIAVHLLRLPALVEPPGRQ